ncbi:hypothetical protein HK101_011733, partial [Irineochytrium annulatum]
MDDVTTSPLRSGSPIGDVAAADEVIGAGLGPAIADPPCVQDPDGYSFDDFEDDFEDEGALPVRSAANPTISIVPSSASPPVSERSEVEEDDLGPLRNDLTFAELEADFGSASASLLEADRHQDEMTDPGLPSVSEVEVASMPPRLPTPPPTVTVPPLTSDATVLARIPVTPSVVGPASPSAAKLVLGSPMPSRLTVNIAIGNESPPDLKMLSDLDSSSLSVAGPAMLEGKEGDVATGDGVKDIVPAIAASTVPQRSATPPQVAVPPTGNETTTGATGGPTPPPEEHAVDPPTPSSHLSPPRTYNHDTDSDLSFSIHDSSGLPSPVKAEMNRPSTPSDDDDGPPPPRVSFSQQNSYMSFNDFLVTEGSQESLPTFTPPSLPGKKKAAKTTRSPSVSPTRRQSIAAAPLPASRNRTTTPASKSGIPRISTLARPTAASSQRSAAAVQPSKPTAADARRKKEALSRVNSRRMVAPTKERSASRSPKRGSAGGAIAAAVESLDGPLRVPQVVRTRVEEHEAVFEAARIVTDVRLPVRDRAADEEAARAIAALGEQREE